MSSLPPEPSAAPETPPERKQAEALFFEGNGRMHAGDPAAAAACYRNAIALAPELAEAHANLGLILEDHGAKEEAEACFRRAIALKPGSARAHLNLGALLASAKRFDEAETAYRQAIVLDPRSPTGWSNLGVLYASVRREADAERCYHLAMDLDNRYMLARFNLSYVLLRQGRFEEGWRCLEARQWYAAVAARIPCPRWQGEPLEGRSLLITYEAGHGDMIQFCRYAAVLKAQGAARIAVVCHPALKTLFATLDGADEIIALDEALPASGWDFWSPPLSLPYHCKTDIDSIPAAIPYLRADPERVAKWTPLLPQEGFRVGLVWRGNPRFENDADRSLPSLATLVPLAAVPGLRFVSLQKGAGEEEAGRPIAGMEVTDIGSAFDDFADVAAVLVGLDLVISVDTAVAHLAGALGVPCWVLLPAYQTDWRWLTDRADTPWYPGRMRLFRQPAIGDWASAIDEVVAALRQRPA